MYQLVIGSKILAMWSRLTLTKRFTVVSLLAIIGSSIGIGAWVSRRIESSVFRLVTETTTLYVDSIIEPNLQELAYQKSITPAHAQALEIVLRTTSFGRDVIAFKVWDTTGHIAYSANPDNIGRVFPIGSELKSALAGEVVTTFSNLDDAENYAERDKYRQLLELYTPVRQEGSNRVIAVAEFYELPNAVQDEISSNQQRGWLIISAAMLCAFGLLIGFVRGASATISQQQQQLAKDVQRLEEVLTQNRELHQRVQYAAAAATELNEKTLWRVGADLHDGPAQELSMSLIRLDHVQAYFDNSIHDDNDNDKNLKMYLEDVVVIKHALRHALDDIRAISTTLVLPNVGQLDLHDALIRVAQTHEWNTRTHVEVVDDQLPEQVSPAVKIAICRIVREALINSYRHGYGRGQRVNVRSDEHYLTAEVSDKGPGFDTNQLNEVNGHLGVAGMRYRVEILGGHFQLLSDIGNGTTVVARLPLNGSTDVL